MGYNLHLFVPVRNFKIYNLKYTYVVYKVCNF